jgi:hypothetical protein
MSVASAPKVRLTKHSVERFQARFRPGLDWDVAANHLAAMLPLGRVVDDPPVWLAHRRREADAYLVLGEDLAMPLARSTSTGAYTAVTCLARGSISPRERQRRKARRDFDRRHRARRA